MCATALVGILLVSAGLQGWLVGLGQSRHRVYEPDIGRFSLGIGGLTLAAPGGGMLGLDHTTLLFAAIIISAPGLFMAWQGGKRRTAALG